MKYLTGFCSLSALLLCAISLSVFGASDNKDAAKASLSVDLTLLDQRNRPVKQPNSGDVIRLQVKLTDVVTGRPPRGLELMGWVRQASSQNTSCEESARGFRATRRVPFGSTDLNGVLLSVLNRDGSVGVIDPKLNLHTSNMVAAYKFEQLPDAMSSDRRNMRSLFAFADQGNIRAVSLLSGDASTLVSGLNSPQDVATFSNGHFWVGESAGQLSYFDPEGKHLQAFSLGKQPVKLRRHPDENQDMLGAFTSDGHLMLADGLNGHLLLQLMTGQNISDASFIGDSSVIYVVDDAARAELRYTDDPERVLEIPLGFQASHIVTGPDQRVAIAFTPGEAYLAVIDLALARVVQPVKLTQASVSTVQFTDNAAFILSHDGGFIGVIDLATVALGKPAVLRQVNLGAKTTRPPDASQLLVPLFPSPQILAVDPDNQTGWIVHETAASVEMPPMDSTRLRGGIPSQVQVVDRSFRETTQGVFETSGAFPAGEHELVLTTGIGGLSSCIAFKVNGKALQAEIRPVSFQAIAANQSYTAGQEEQLTFNFFDQNGKEIYFEQMQFLAPSMNSSWSQTFTAKRQKDGQLQAWVRFPHTGTFVLQPLGLPSGYVLRAAVLIEVQS